MNGYYINSHCCPKYLLIDNFKSRSISRSYHLAIREYIIHRPLFQRPNFPSKATGNKTDIFSKCCHEAYTKTLETPSMCLRVESTEISAFLILSQQCHNVWQFQLPHVHSKGR